MSEIAKVHTSVIVGLDAIPVEVETLVSNGTPTKFQIVGMGDNAVRESRERIPIALEAAGFKVPKQIIVNLAPAEMKKEGASLDLAIAASILIASSQIRQSQLCFIHGELSLDSSVRPIRGTLAHAITAYHNKANKIILPAANVEEALLLKQITALPIETLTQIGHLLNVEAPQSAITPPSQPITQQDRVIFADVWGQKHAKRALAIAAAGGHNVLMQGPPGCGKSMLARRFTRLLPPLTTQEMLETVKIHSIAGRPISYLLEGLRPICIPHQDVSSAGLIGGGALQPYPGDVSLAHHGVLFMDELPEFKKSVIEGLRTPLETGLVEIRRAKYGVKFPANFQLLAAMNCCPCGRLGSHAKNIPCSCSAAQITAYQARVSQPIRDRIDLHISLQAVTNVELFQRANNNTIDANSDRNLQKSILTARNRQLERAGCLNASLDGNTLKKFLNQNAQSFLEGAVSTLGLSARSYVRTLRVARTIADLRVHEKEKIDEQDIAEALSYREGK